ncbi:hypothetical protein V1505DRAFT_378218 [Lipomyces doorenjongii]
MSNYTSYPEVAKTGLASLPPEVNISTNAQETIGASVKAELPGTENSGKLKFSRTICGLTVLKFFVVSAGTIVAFGIGLGVGLGVGLQPNQPISHSTSSILLSTLTTSYSWPTTVLNIMTSTSFALPTSRSASARLSTPSSLSTSATTPRPTFTSSTHPTHTTPPSSTSTLSTQSSTPLSLTVTLSTEGTNSLPATSTSSTQSTHATQPPTSSAPPLPWVDVYLIVNSPNATIDGMSIAWAEPPNSNEVYPILLEENTNPPWIYFTKDNTTIWTEIQTTSNNILYFQVQDSLVVAAAVGGDFSRSKLDINNSGLVAFNGDTNFCTAFNTTIQGLPQADNQWRASGWQLYYYSVYGVPVNCIPLVINIAYAQQS